MARRAKHSEFSENAARGSSARRRLGPHDLAFFRAVLLEGLKLTDAARIYLAGRPLERMAERHLRWVRRELVTAAKRHNQLKAARVIHRPLPPTVPHPRGAPTLGQLHEQHPDFSERELLELLAELDPTPAEKKKERRRMTARRLRAIASLRLALDILDRYARLLPPQEADPVEAWLVSAVANGLRARGICTLCELCTVVDQRGYRWFVDIPGLGPRKAVQTVEWLRARIPGFAERVGERALVPMHVQRPALLAGRKKQTGIVPFEYFQPTADTDGYDSPLRRPPAAGGITAVDDRDAIHRWLLTHLTPTEAASPHHWEKNATYRAYRREVERLWAWAVVHRNKALSALTDEDVTAYTIFLLDPQPRDQWVGPRKPRWHPEWRPFTTLPSPRSREHILTVIDALFDWWFRQGYIVRNPWRAGLKQERVQRAQFAKRSLSLAAWDAVREWVTALPDGEKKARLRALLALLYGSGLRRSELAAAAVQDLQSHLDDDGQIGWDLQVLGKGQRTRTVPVVEPAMEALKDYFAQRFGEPRLPLAEAPIPLFATLPHPVFRPKRGPLNAWGINAAVQEAFLQASRQVAHDSPLAGELRLASAHWLRHTFATHAVKYDDAPLAVLQKILGHASITTTANNYVDEDRQMRQAVARAMAQRTQM